MSGAILPLKSPPTLPFARAQRHGIAWRVAARALPSAFAFCAALLPGRELLFIFRLRASGSKRSALFVRSKNAFSSGTAFCASALIHDSMGVPPTEELISPTGTPSVLWISRPQK